MALVVVPVTREQVFSFWAIEQPTQAAQARSRATEPLGARLARSRRETRDRRRRPRCTARPCPASSHPPATAPSLAGSPPPVLCSALCGLALSALRSAAAWLLPPPAGNSPHSAGMCGGAMVRGYGCGCYESSRPSAQPRKRQAACSRPAAPLPPPFLL